MKIIILIFTVFLFTTTYALSCSSGNPCKFDSYYGPHNGYNCLESSGLVFCTCPNGGYEVDQECRPCNRRQPSQNACIGPNLLMCVENRDCGESYMCICNDPATGVPFTTTDRTCDKSIPSKCPPTTGPGTGSSSCLNGGVSVNGGVCQCPTGFSGLICQDKSDDKLCDRIQCKNGGVCAVQRPYGPYEPVCLCPRGTWGEFCELIGTSGFCLSSTCAISGACRENVVGSTRYAYCQCQPGYRGTKCAENYFTCKNAGKFADEEMQQQGKYFECTSTGNTSFRLEQKSCARGFNFDNTLKICKLP